LRVHPCRKARSRAGPATCCNACCSPGPNTVDADLQAFTQRDQGQIGAVAEIEVPGGRQARQERFAEGAGLEPEVCRAAAQMARQPVAQGHMGGHVAAPVCLEPEAAGALALLHRQAGLRRLRGPVRQIDQPQRHTVAPGRVRISSAQRRHAPRVNLCHGEADR
jgi:hypothetical protein